MATTIYNKNTMSTSEVKKMQQALVDKGYSVGSSGVDGIWGKDTAAALSQYKTDIGQNNSYGTTVGNSTLNQLYGSSKSSSSKSSSVPALTYTPTATQYDADIVGYQGLIGSYDNAIANAGASYQNIANMYNSSANAQNAALQQAMGASADEINSLYDNSARDYYRLYKTQQKELPENLSRAGITGGASESSQLKLLNSYSDNLYNNESARDNALAGNTADYQNQIAQNSINAANQLAGYYQSYQNQVAGYAQAQAEAQSQLNSLIAQQQAAAAVDKWNANVTERINQQLGRTGGDTLWTYTTSDGKLHWTTDRNNAKALSSTYDLNEISSVSKKASSGSGSGSASSSKNTTKTAGSSSSTKQSTVARTGGSNIIAINQITNQINSALSASQLNTAAANIEKAVNNGLITEADGLALAGQISSKLK